MGVFRSLLFGKYLIVTNTVSCGVMMGFGDLIQQRCEQWKRTYFDSIDFHDEDSTPLMRQCSNNLIDNDIASVIIHENTSDCENRNHDYVRTRNMIAVGLVQGPFHHFFYAFLDRFLPGRNASSVVKKTFIDQAVASPTCLAIFFFGLGALENRNSQEMLGEIRKKFLETYKVDCCFWPPSQLINFIFVPMRYRVIYINLMTMFYDIFLSHTKYVS